MMPPALKVSVVIPTCNRAGKLRQLLDDLACQSLPQDEFEVIVVDDGSGDDTGATVLEWQKGRSNVKYLKQPNRGQSIARNYGIAEAQGAVLGFVDDDCRVGPEWLASALPHFEDPGVGGVQGLTWCDPREISALTMQVRNLDDGNYETCNIFYRSEVIRKIGGFDPRLRFYREDTDLAWRVLDAGFRIPFAPEARVEHPPHRYTIRQLLRKRFRFRWAYYDRYFEKKHPARFRKLKLLGVFSPATAAFYPVYLSAGLLLILPFLPCSCPAAGLVGAALLLSVYVYTCLLYVNETARGLRLEWILRRRRELMLFLAFWWLVMAGELAFHLAGSARFGKFSL